MLLNIADMPEVKLCKILTADKIARKSTLIETFPLTYADVGKYNQTSQRNNKENPRPLIPVGLQDALWRMVRACLADDGLGLAAPQIGIFKRVFIIRESEAAFRVYFHPQYTVDSSSTKEVKPEGCLSVPGKRIPVARATAIYAQWLDFDQSEKMVVRTEILEGLKARAFQHELDHLNGISILDKVKSK